MEKYENYTSILKQFDEKMEFFNEEGQELSAINNAIRALKDKKISFLIRRADSAFENLVHDHKYSDVTSSDRISQDANELNGVVSELNSEYNDITDIKSALIAREYHGDNKNIVDEIVENVNGSLEVIDLARNKSQDVLDNNFDKYMNEEVEIKEVEESKEVNKESNSLESVLKADDEKPLEEAVEEKVENVEEVDAKDFKIEDFSIDELNKSLDESLKEEFHNQEIKTDSIEEDNKEEIEENDNLEELTNLFKDDELDKELDKISEDKEELKSAQDELDSLLYFPGVEEDKLPVIEDDEEINLGNVQNDYKEIPEGFQKVISVESTDSLQQENDEQKVYSRVA